MIVIAFLIAFALVSIAFTYPMVTLITAAALVGAFILFSLWGWARGW